MLEYSTEILLILNALLLASGLLRFWSLPSKQKGENRSLEMPEIKIPPIEIEQKFKHSSLALDDPQRFEMKQLHRIANFDCTLIALYDRGLDETYPIIQWDNGRVISLGNLSDV